MKLTKQQEQILSLLADGAWHCGQEINNLYIKDDRKRISELNKLGYTILGEPCKLHRHPSGMYMRRLTKVPQELPSEPQIKFEPVVNGQEIVLQTVMF